MRTDENKDSDLMGLTVLIAPTAPPELASELEHQGARVLTWPEIEFANPESFAALDETIENLFGYDWLVFRTGRAVEFFLRRFQQLGHEISELDSLRVGAIGEVTVAKLEASQVHIDLIPGSFSPDRVFAAIENYVGGRAALGRLNFLMPRASAPHDSLRDLLGEAEARVDAVAAYRNVSNRARLAQLNALISGGGIDCLAFDSPSSVRDLAELLDPLELATIIAGIQSFSPDEGTTRTANEFGLRPHTGSEPTTRSMVDAIAERSHAGDR
jgi:uroporphyrinogen III methyltransferase / synthase